MARSLQPSPPLPSHSLESLRPARGGWGCRQAAANMPKRRRRISRRRLRAQEAALAGASVCGGQLLAAALACRARAAAAAGPPPPPPVIKATAERRRPARRPLGGGWCGWCGGQAACGTSPPGDPPAGQRRPPPCRLARPTCPKFWRAWPGPARAPRALPRPRPAIPASQLAKRPVASTRPRPDGGKRRCTRRTGDARAGEETTGARARTAAHGRLRPRRRRPRRAVAAAPLTAHDRAAGGAGPIVRARRVSERGARPERGQAERLRRAPHVAAPARPAAAPHWAADRR